VCYWRCEGEKCPPACRGFPKPEMTPSIIENDDLPCSLVFRGEVRFCKEKQSGIPGYKSHAQRPVKI
jgi:hypothetical protein